MLEVKLDTTEMRTNKSRLYIFNEKRQGKNLTSENLYFTQSQTSIMIQIDGEESARMSPRAQNISCLRVSQWT